jgi:bifunctional non-homologous end joining protein LigD
VRLFSRNGYDWTSRYPWIVEAARKIRQTRFVLDGEAVILGVDGIAGFDALHSRQHDEEVQFCAFDILVEGSDDLRKLPLHLRTTNLRRLLARRPEGIFVNPFERGEIGPELFQAACRMGLEGLVSKHRDRPYQAARVKNRKHPAMYRVMDALA